MAKLSLKIRQFPSIKWLSLTVAWVLVSAGCASTSSQRKIAGTHPDSDEIPEVTDVQMDTASEDEDTASDPIADTSEESLNAISAKWIKPFSPDAEVQIEGWVDYFSKRDSERFARFIKRGHLYRDVVQDILKQNGVPPEFYYLGMIESGFANHAKSFASAVGSWQFIKGTGTRYGLHIDHYVDERRDPIRATEAAAKYLRDLHEMFNSWELAMAAYNCGEARVKRAIRRGRTQDFWRLSKLRLLPPETRAYVPKFIAAVRIGSAPDRFGFDTKEILQADEKYPSVEAVEVPSPIRLDSISRVTGVPIEALAEVNPHLRLGITPPSQSKYEVWIPEEHVKKVQLNSTLLDKYRIAGLRSIPLFEGYAKASSRHHHRVRPGETLAQIARKNRVSVAYLKRINGLKSGQIQAGAVLRTDARTYRQSGVTRLLAGGRVVVTKLPAKQSSSPRVLVYRVKRGDNLTEIAKKFQVSLQWLKKANGLKSGQVQVGQMIVVKSNSSSVL